MKIVDKVWGEEQILVNTKLYCLKYLYLKKGFQCSIHKHLIKNETFIMVSGDVYLEHGKKKCRMELDVPIQIHPTTYHRFSGLEDSVIIEVSTRDRATDSYRKTESGTFDLDDLYV